MGIYTVSWLSSNWSPSDSNFGSLPSDDSQQSWLGLARLSKVNLNKSRNPSSVETSKSSTNRAAKSPVSNLKSLWDGKQDQQASWD
jgi:hypothetical protein